MLGLLFVLAGSPIQAPPTEADYNDAVRCAAAAGFAQFFASNLNISGTNVLTVLYGEREEALTTFALRFGDYGGIASEDVNEAIDLRRQAAIQSLTRIQTQEEADAVETGAYKEADDCAGILTRFSAM